MDGTLRVLVVDDEPGIRQAVSRVLAPHRTVLPDESTETAFDVAQAGERRGGARGLRGGSARHPPARLQASRVSRVSTSSSGWAPRRPTPSSS